MLASISKASTGVATAPPKFVAYFISSILSSLFSSSIWLQQSDSLFVRFYSPSYPTMHLHECVFEAVDRHHGWLFPLGGVSIWTPNLQDPPSSEGTFFASSLDFSTVRKESGLSP